MENDRESSKRKLQIRIIVRELNSSQADSGGSGIMIDDSIFIVSGYEDPHPIERLELEGDVLVDQEVIGHTVYSSIPVLLKVSADYCA